MSTELERRVAGLASTWEVEAPPISLAEITARRRSDVWDADLGRIDIPAADITVTTAPRTRRPDHRRSFAIAAALLVAVTGTIVLARRAPDRVDPGSPATTTPVVVTNSTLPEQTSTEQTSPERTVPSPTDPPGPSVVAEPGTDRPVLLPLDEVLDRLGAIDAERREALRVFTTIGFTVERSQTLPDGSPYEDGGPSVSRARVVMRNDGSVAVVSESFGISYYDAAAGSARAVFTNADGTTGYQQVDGQADSSLGLGIPTGLVNGIITPLVILEGDVVAIEEDVVDGRATWRIDQYSDGIAPFTPIEASTWIDRETGITLRTRSIGALSIDQGGDTRPITQTISLSEIVPNEPMPADFPSPFPPEAQIAVSGDRSQFGPSTYEEAAAQLGPGAVVPTIDADQVSVSRMVSGEGPENVGVTLVVRWFDGFVKTELTVTRFPAALLTEDPCLSCEPPLLDQLRVEPVREGTVYVEVGDVEVVLRGNPERIPEIIDSLVTTG